MTANLKPDQSIAERQRYRERERERKREREIKR